MTTATLPVNVSASLYVGDLASDVNEPQLHEIFRVIGPIQSIRLCRDAFTRRSLGYAYVNFVSVEDAERALEALNYTAVKGKPMRIMWSHRDPSIRRSGVGNVFIKNLHPNIDNKALNDTFSQFGNILSCKVATDENGKSRGFGFVHFETQEAADLAIESVDGKEMLDQQVFVSMWKSRRERMRQNQERFTNLFVKNFPLEWTTDHLRNFFSAYGEITSAIVMTKPESTDSKGFGFVNFATTEQAKVAVQEANGKEVEGKALYVARAQKKAERRAELSQKHQQMQRDKQHAGVNLYVKNLDDDIDDDRLYREFAPFGNITSHKIARDQDGVSRGFGFVCFATPEEATRAVTELNTRMIGSKPLYVALHQKKEVRRQHLEAQRAQRAAVSQFSMQPHMVPPPNVYPPNMFYPGGPMPPQGYPGYPPNMRGAPRWPAAPQVPGGAMPGGEGFPPQAVAPGFMGPPQGHRGPQRGGRRGGQGGAGGRGGAKTGFRLTSAARNREHVPPQPNPMGPGGFPMQPMYMAPPHPEQDLASVLAASTPEDRRTILGERLYPLVEQACMPKQDMAPKVTGMLLQMEPGDILQLLESPEDLSAKVAEAIALIEYSATHPTEEGETATPAGPTETASS